MRAICWDFDGTLAERPGLWSQCLADLANAHTREASHRREHFAPHLQVGFPWHSPAVSHCEIQTAEEWWASLRPTIQAAFRTGGGFSSADAAMLTSAVRDEYTNSIRWRVFTDVATTLSFLAERGWRHVILSNHVPELPKLVEALGLAPFFDAIHTSALTGYEKPHPRAFMNALPHGTEVHSAVMVGDSHEADVRGAEAVGIRSFLVRKPDPSRDGRINDLAYVAAALSEANPQSN